MDRKVPAPFNRLLMPMAVMWRSKVHPNRLKVGEDYDCSTAATEVATGVPACALGLAIWGGILAPFAGYAAVDDLIVVNAHTGLAISGFDPVAYFADAKPEIGRTELELRADGVVWRFTTRAIGRPLPTTRRSIRRVSAATIRWRSPVAPRCRGIPLFWAVTGERLYLFYSAEARTAFLADPGRILEPRDAQMADSRPQHRALIRYRII